MGFQIIGLMGTFCVILSYWQVSMGKWMGHDIKCLSINLLGAILLGVSLYAHPNIGSITIEVFYGAISLFGMWKRFHK